MRKRNTWSTSSSVQPTRTFTSNALIRMSAATTNALVSYRFRVNTSNDGERAHDKLIKELDLKEEFYKTNTHDKEYLENMTLINNMCSWLKRYIYRFIGMRMTNLQSYLNWFVYLFRVKGAVEQWPKMDRILRHLILFNGTYKRNT